MQTGFPGWKDNDCFDICIILLDRRSNVQMETISPLIGCSELAARLDDPSLTLFDITVELPSPRFDGDYRVESGQKG